MILTVGHFMRVFERGCLHYKLNFWKLHVCSDDISSRYCVSRWIATRQNR